MFYSQNKGLKVPTENQIKHTKHFLDIFNFQTVNHNRNYFLPVFMLKRNTAFVTFLAVYLSKWQTKRLRQLNVMKKMLLPASEILY